jgi:adenylosuccinate synthase
MHSHIVVGLAFGDEGKGSWVDHLCRLHNIKTVVRFNGGAQALHHVTTESGVTHGFSQFGSHSFIPGAKTMLSRYMLIEPLELMREACELREKGIVSPLRTLFISAQAPIIPYTNLLLNRIMESSRGDRRHGSCGLGIGLTQRDIDEGTRPVILAGDLNDRSVVAAKVHEHLLRTLQEAAQWVNPSSNDSYQKLKQFEQSVRGYIDTLCSFAQQVRIIPEAAFLSVIRRDQVVFEGAQGAMLDQCQGTFPFCTRSTTTSQNALTLIREAGFSGDVTRHGLLRAYGTRHGAGPFVTEADVTIPLCDNSTGEWQGVFRQGWFDAVAARTALGFSEVDEVVLTNLDRLNKFDSIKFATAYQNCDDAFYDASHHSLRKVKTYEESTLRSNQLTQATPVYNSVPGYVDEQDTRQVEFVLAIQAEIGQTITALSNRKDHHKIHLV